MPLEVPDNWAEDENSGTPRSLRYNAGAIDAGIVDAFEYERSKSIRKDNAASLSKCAMHWGVPELFLVAHIDLLYEDVNRSIANLVVLLSSHWDPQSTSSGAMQKTRGGDFSAVWSSNSLALVVETFNPDRRGMHAMLVCEMAQRLLDSLPPEERNTFQSPRIWEKRANPAFNSGLLYRAHHDPHVHFRQPSAESTPELQQSALMLGRRSASAFASSRKWEASEPGSFLKWYDRIANRIQPGKRLAVVDEDGRVMESPVPVADVCQSLDFAPFLTLGDGSVIYVTHCKGGSESPELNLPPGYTATISIGKHGQNVIRLSKDGDVATGSASQHNRAGTFGP